MPRYTVVRRRHHPIRNLLIILLLAVLVYVGFAGYSLYKIYDDAQSAQSAYRNAEQALSSGDVTSAVNDVRTLSSAAADIGDQADSWVWVAGENIPWIGEDITVGRGLAHVSDSLCNDALMPVLDQYAGITSGKGSLSDAASAVDSASSTITSCEQQLNGLGTSHFSQLNDAKSKLQEAVGAVGGSLTGVSSAINALGALSGVASALAG